MVTKVAYLLGAGASEGAVKFHGYGKSILMYGIQEEIEQILLKDDNADMNWVRNELTTGANLERLVSLFEYSGTSKHLQIAKELRSHFRKVLEARIEEIEPGFVPELIMALLDMHRVEDVGEQVTAIFTTNYEDLIERAANKIHGGVNYPIQLATSGKTFPLTNAGPPIVKLHGSFNWKSDFPISFTGTSDHSDDGVWIPPGVMKRKEIYPFNILWGKAKELMDCDVLRIIGSSLSLNDWELVALISIAQGLGANGSRKFSVELIDSPRKKEEITDTHHYLDVVGILDMDFVREFLINSYMGSDRDTTDGKLESLLQTAVKGNIFETWLRAKGEKMYNDDKSLDTPSGDFKEFILRGLGGA